jgi:recombinational DNA repair protein RecR
MTEEANKKDDVKEAIIKTLSKKIVEELAKELNVTTGLNADGSIRIEPTTLAIKNLVRKLAEKRLAYGIAMKKDPEEW